MSEDTPKAARKTRRGFVRTVAAAGAVAGMSGVALAGEEKNDECKEEEDGESKKEGEGEKKGESKKKEKSKKGKYRDKESYKDEDEGNPKDKGRPDVAEKKEKKKGEAPDVNG